jgi:hypothetical protein
VDLAVEQVPEQAFNILMLRIDSKVLIKPVAFRGATMALQSDRDIADVVRSVSLSS